MTFQPRRNKFNARKTVVDGITFDSAKEARVWNELKVRERKGEIHGLERQVRIALHALGGELVGHYVADFRFVEPGKGVVVMDAKGFKPPLYTWKARHFKAEYGKEIVEV